MRVTQSCPTLREPIDCMQPVRLFCLDKNTGVGCHFPLQGTFLIQGSNTGLLHCRQILYHLSYQGSLATFNTFPRISIVKTLLFLLLLFKKKKNSDLLQKEGEVMALFKF